MIRFVIPKGREIGEQAEAVREAVAEARARR
jgi:hypothetical protein